MRTAADLASETRVRHAAREWSRDALSDAADEDFVRRVLLDDCREFACRQRWSWLYLGLVAGFTLGFVAGLLLHLAAAMLR